MKLILSNSFWIFILILLTGCSSTPQHRSRNEFLAGNTYPVEVIVPLAEDESATGKIYYRLKQRGTFQQSDLSKEGRGGRLFADLPTQEMKAGEHLEYYIAVAKGAESYRLRSELEPYQADALSKENFITKALSTYATYTYAGETMSFTLNAASHDVREVKVFCQFPGKNEMMSMNMDRYGSETWKLVIPGSFVPPGIWMYRVEVTIEGVHYRLPEDGFYSFQLNPRLSAQ
jgi:hypothetical protein